MKNQKTKTCDKTLVIVTKTNAKNHHLFDKKILGLTSVEWITLRVGTLFKKVVCRQDWGNDENCVYIEWDNTLVNRHALFCDGGTRLCNTTFAHIQATLQSYVLDSLVEKGVVLHSRQGLHIDCTANIQSGTEIFAPNVICGNVEIKSGTVIYPYCFLHDCAVGKNVSVGPFATIRPGSIIDDDCRIGNFVEVKNSVVKKNTKIAHLAYVGDAQVGCGVNVGCGVVFANFDGKTKHKTVVGDNCFLGCNSNLVAPLCIGDGCFVAAGTTVTKDVGADSFVIGRTRQSVKDL
ncbi:MAG: hypothetical protein E7344_02345 [Clostridiales bacterium]|nr:hypothetical protein [Clostridiales bacterium]